MIPSEELGETVLRCLSSTTFSSTVFIQAPIQPRWKFYSLQVNCWAFYPRFFAVLDRSLCWEAFWDLKDSTSTEHDANDSHWRSPSCSLTPIILPGEKFEEALSATSAENMKRPLEVDQHLTPSDPASYDSISTRLLGRTLSKVQHVPKLVSRFFYHSRTERGTLNP